MNEILLKPGQVPLADWRAIYRGAGVALDPATGPAIADSAAAVERILAKGAPVYGINTGFGKLASVRIEAEDLERLQRNIVLSHAAGVGEPVPVPVARLMLALKLAGLAQGASGVRPATIALLAAMLDRGLTPVISAPWNKVSARKSPARAWAVENCVPLSRASPSLGPSVSGSSPARARACAAGTRWPSKNISPTPIIAAAMCDSGARSPDAPTDPCAGITGVRPRSSIAANRAMVAGRTPEAP